MNTYDVPGFEAARQLGANYSAKKRVVFVVNNDISFLTHRAVWAGALQSAGASVTVLAKETGYGDAIRKLGFQFEAVDLGRESISGMQSVRAAIRIFFLLMRLRPELVFLIATAAYSLGWPAAVFLRSSRFIRVAGGAGRVLAGQHSRSGATFMVRGLLNVAARLHNVFTLFQIDSDRDLFIEGRLASAVRSMVIPGTGVDTQVWRPGNKSEASTMPVVTLFASRLYREKGIYEFLEIARRLKGPGRSFVVVGEPDTGVSSSVSQFELDEAVSEGIIELWGRRNDMISVFQASDIFVFPSTHPEGTPKVVIEASSCGVPAVVSGQAGCRAVVDDQKTGFVVDEVSVGSFALMVERLIDSPELRVNMAREARAKAQAEFSLEAVLGQVLQFAGVDTNATRKSSPKADAK
ncbi:glycosyltransferase [Plantibacter sp. Mn2098]|uniref:glycosyltransferase n=1 Tax=Plantibacter sp. Mn2098 TaxID=3395266 RepID=UPI003BBC4B9C